MDALGPGAVGEELQAAGGHGERDALRHRRLALGEAGKPGGRQRRAERADQARRMMPAHMEPALRRLADPRRRLDADQIGGQQVPPACAGRETLRQRRDERRGRGMDHAVGVRVVIVEAVDERAVDQRRVAQRQADIRADYGRRPLAGEPAHGVYRAPAELVAGRGERDADAVEDVQARALHHPVRNRAVVEPAGEIRQHLGYRPVGGRRFPGYCRLEPVHVPVLASIALFPTAIIARRGNCRYCTGTGPFARTEHPCRRATARPSASRSCSPPWSASRRSMPSPSMWRRA